MGIIKINMLGFPVADRTLIDAFNSNYLKTIIFQVKYPINEKVFENKDTYLRLFDGLFTRVSESQQNGFEISMRKDQTPILQPITAEKNGIELRSENGQKVLAILKDGINLTINDSVYKNFENICSELKLICEVLVLLEVTHINRVAIRKVNIVDFEIPTNMNETYSIGVMQLLIHPELLNNINYFPSLNSIVQSIHNVLFRKDETTLNLKYGMMQSVPTEKKGQILLDIDLFNESSIESSGVLNTFSEINKEVFNIFNWAMKPDAVFHLMNKK